MYLLILLGNTSSNLMPTMITELMMYVIKLSSKYQVTVILMIL